MILEYIRYTIPIERAREFAEAYASAGKILHEDNHCLGFEISQGVEEPQHWIVRIQWDSVEGHEQGFRKASHFPKFLAAVKPFFDNIEEMRHYRIQNERKAR